MENWLQFAVFLCGARDWTKALPDKQALSS